MRNSLKPENTKPPAPAGYYPIKIAALRVDTITGFDIFLAIAEVEAPILFSDRNLPVTLSKLDRLRETGHAQIYVSLTQEEDYHRYIEEHLESILTDESLPVPARAEVLYESAQYHLQEVFSSPRSSELVARSKSIVRSSCEFLIKQRSAFAHILSIVSYDYCTYTHSVNTFVYSILLVQRAGISKPQTLYDFGEGALLHDVGKSMLDPLIVRSKTKLTADEWKLMRKHPVYGYEILMDRGHLDSIGLDVVRHHHEKLDGSGYPDGLKGGQIHPMVRMFSITDIFDALTTKRPYKAALPTFEALRLMQDEMDKELDPEYFRMFVQLMGSPGAQDAPATVQ